MAIIINELEVTDSRPETADRDEPPPSAAPVAIELVDIAQRLAQLEERELRVEAY